MASGPGIYLAVGLTVAASLLIGAALCIREDRGWSWLAPGVGFAAILTIGWVSIRLPGDGVTAAVLILLAALASIYRLRGRVDWRQLWVGVPTAGLVLFAASLPFLANHTFGAIGATINDDLALHLEFADILRLGDAADKSVDISYPVGPHSLVAALSDSLGMSIQSAFLGMLIAVPVVTALTALAGLEHVRAPARPIGASLVGLGYLSAAFYAQASFKETIIATLTLTFVLVLRELVRDRSRWRWFVIPIVVLVFAGLGTFSVPALAWFVGIAGSVALVTMGIERIRPSWRLGFGVLALGAALVATVAIFEALTSFFSEGPGRYLFTGSSGGKQQSAGGNLVGPLSPFQGLGVWPAADFRGDPTENGWELGVALATLATVVGISLTIARRDWVLLTGTAFVVLTYVLVGEVSLAYNAAKALVIAAPLITLAAMAGLLTRVRGRGRALLLAGLAALFVLAAAHSSLMPLKGGIIRPNTQAEAFAQIRDAVTDEPTIFLGRDNYAAWELRSTRIAYLGFGARAAHYGFHPQPGGTFNHDLDSLAPEELESGALLVTPNTLYASQPGPEFRHVLTNRWYKLYRRTRPSPPRYVLHERGEPGATLNCSTERGKEALRLGGRAFVRPPPVVGPVGAWTFLGGEPTPLLGGPSAPADFPVALASNRQEMRQTIYLPKGRWEISLSWASVLPIDAKVGERRLTLPPFIGDGDRHWRVASVRGGRAVEIVLLPGPERRFDVPRGVQVGTVAAVREDVRGRFIPVRRACGRYVDFIEP